MFGSGVVLSKNCKDKLKWREEKWFIDDEDTLMVSVWTFRSFLSWSRAALAFLSSCSLDLEHFKSFPSVQKEESHETANVKKVFFPVLRIRIPNPDLDPRVFGPPGSGSGSTSQRYGSGSFYYHAKKVRQTLALLFCDSFWLFILWKMM